MNGVEQIRVHESLPVVDVERICKNEGANEDEYLRVGKETLKALEDHGYVYFKNLGIFDDMLKTVREKMEEFFDLDKDTKLKYKRNLLTMHGYSNEMLEILQTTDVDQESCGDPTRTMEKPQDGEKQNALKIRTSGEGQPQLGRESFDFRTTDSFPKEVPGLGEAVTSFNSKFYSNVAKIFKSLDLVLDLPENLMQEYHDFSSECSHMSGFRVLRYSPIDTDGELRLKEHIDIFVSVTFHLYQSNQGLQIKDKNGEWQDVELQPDTVLMFPSQVLQILTGDKIPAAFHRVTVPESAKEKQQYRYSIISFIGPRGDALIKPFDGSDKYDPMLFQELFYRMAKKLSTDYDVNNYELLKEYN